MLLEEYPHQIIIEEFTKVDDGAGGYTEEWGMWKESEANVQPISGNEFYQAQQLKSNLSYNVFIPYIEGVKSSMRVKYGDITLLISVVIDQGGCNEVLLLKCSL